MNLAGSDLYSSFQNKEQKSVAEEGSQPCLYTHRDDFHTFGHSFHKPLHHIVFKNY